MSFHPDVVSPAGCSACRCGRYLGDMPSAKTNAGVLSTSLCETKANQTIVLSGGTKLHSAKTTTIGIFLPWIRVCDARKSDVLSVLVCCCKKRNVFSCRSEFQSPHAACIFRTGVHIPMWLSRRKRVSERECFGALPQGGKRSRNRAQQQIPAYDSR